MVNTNIERSYMNTIIKKFIFIVSLCLMRSVLSVSEIESIHPTPQTHEEKGIQNKDPEKENSEHLNDAIHVSVTHYNANEKISQISPTEQSKQLSSVFNKLHAEVLLKIKTIFTDPKATFAQIQNSFVALSNDLTQIKNTVTTMLKNLNPSDSLYNPLKMLSKQIQNLEILIKKLGTKIDTVVQSAKKKFQNTGNSGVRNNSSFSNSLFWEANAASMGDLTNLIGAVAEGMGSALQGLGSCLQELASSGPEAFKIAGLVLTSPIWGPIFILGAMGQ